MLQYLHLKNFILIDEIKLDFSQGMTVITGETGAGKSILIDAIALATGARAHADVVLSGKNQAEITAQFTIEHLPKVKKLLQENDLYEDSEVCILRRVISQDGRSKNYINDRMVTLQNLRKIGEVLIDIHAQHANYLLMQTQNQLQLLDDFAEAASLKSQLKTIFSTWQTLHQQREKLQQTLQDQTAKQQYLQFQIQEFLDLDLQPTEYEELNQQQKQLANYEKIASDLGQLQNILSDGDINITQQLQHCVNVCKDLQNYDQTFVTINKLLEEAVIQIEEANLEIKHKFGDLQMDPELLQTVEIRLSKIMQLARKHRIPPQELFNFHKKLQDEINSLNDAEQEYEKINKQLKQIEIEYFEIAKKLSELRKQSAEQFAKIVTKNLQELNMRDTKFLVTWREMLTEPKLHGLDQIEFMLLNNHNSEQQPLAKVASGGELSRISLAIQAITAKITATPTLIFDEVDVGIGGGTAEKVGRMLRQLSKYAQVICITHLPQVAICSHQHITVTKLQQSKRTQVGIKILTKTEKIDEIARMLGGAKITEQTVAHAREMLEMVDG